jgi:uncharacterized Zn finger protein
MNCPMCGLPEKYLEDYEKSKVKSRCKGCGTIFFNKERYNEQKTT